TWWEEPTSAGEGGAGSTITSPSTRLSKKNGTAVPSGTFRDRSAGTFMESSAGSSASSVKLERTCTLSPSAPSGRVRPTTVGVTHGLHAGGYCRGSEADVAHRWRALQDDLGVPGDRAVHPELDVGLQSGGAALQVGPARADQRPNARAHRRLHRRRRRQGLGK